MEDAYATKETESKNKKITARIAKEVLLFLSQKDISWPNEVFKEINKKLKKKINEKLEKKQEVVSWSTLWNTLVLLKEYRLIKILERTRINEKGHRKHLVSITLHGLLAVFLFKDSWKYFDKIRSVHKNDIPLLFGKWEHFAKHKVENIIIQRMQEHYKILPSSCFFDTSPIDDELMDKIKMRQKLESLYDHVLFYPLEIWKNDEALRWEKMIKNNPDLTDYIKRRFDYYIRLTQRDLKKLELRRSQFNSII